MNEGQALIESVFGIALNPTLDYHVQLQDALGSSGDLSSKARTNEILITLCQIVDKQAKQIKALEDDRVEIANKMIELQGKGPQSPVVPLDATKPLDALSTPPTTE